MCICILCAFFRYNSWRSKEERKHYINVLFEKYGSNGSMTVDGLDQMLQNMGYIKHGNGGDSEHKNHKDHDHDPQMFDKKDHDHEGEDHGHEHDYTEHSTRRVGHIGGRLTKREEHRDHAQVRKNGVNMILM